jgi:hypothetical protein
MSLMDPFLLNTYVNWYEQLHPYLRRALPSAAILLFVVGGFLGARVSAPRRVVVQFLMLNSAACFFVAGAYLDFSPLITLATSLALLVMYVGKWGLIPPEYTNSPRVCHVIAFTTIAISTFVKLYHLEAWPPLLNDYAAQTGADAFLRFAKAPLTWNNVRLTPHLYSGGASLIHAPFTLLSFSVFGYSIYAVRFVEVIGSVAALSFFWLWLQTLRIGPAGLLALVAFALSSEHIATSRMGTFYSVSQAVGLCIAWLLSQVTSQDGKLIGRYVAGLVVGMFLLPFCYAPTAALFILIPAFLWVVLPYRTLSRTHQRCVIVLGLCVVSLAFAAWYRQVPFKTFRRVTPILATDAPVWFKVDTAVNMRAVQSPITIVSNALGNIRLILAESFHPNIFQEPVYTFATGVLLYTAVLGLWSRQWRPVALYAVIGFLPMIATFPLQRRGMLIRPLVPLVLALYIREYWGQLVIVFKNRLVRTIFGVALMVIVGTIPLHGLYLFAKYNGSIGIGPSFGPEYARQFIDHLKELVKDHSLVVLNTGRSRWQYEMEFADVLRREPFMVPTITLATVSPRSSLVQVLPAQRPLAVAFLNETKRGWILPLMHEQLPKAEIREITHGQSVVGWVAILSK